MQVIWISGLSCKSQQIGCLQSLQQQSQMIEQISLTHQNELEKMLNSSLAPSQPEQVTHSDPPKPENPILTANTLKAETSSQTVQQALFIVDPIAELSSRRSVLPVLAVIDQLDLTMMVDDKSLLSHLCTWNLELDVYLKNRQIIFRPDADNRSSLHQAIAANDIGAVNFCLKNGVPNQRDNFGNSPILEAIKLGRRSCFLLCLHYQYYDSQAPHYCAAYNRAWELKILHSMGYDILSCRDSLHFSPIQRAVENYSYEAAEYLAEIISKVDMKKLQESTGSKGIIRLVKKARERAEFFPSAVLPFLYFISNWFLLFFAIHNFEIYKQYINPLANSLWGLLAIIAGLTLFGISPEKNKNTRRPNLLSFIQVPQDLDFTQMCPQCLKIRHINDDHCRKCQRCVKGYHFHSFTCVHDKNQIFWFLSEIFSLFILHHLFNILLDSQHKSELLLLNYRNRFYFGLASVFSHLWQKPYQFVWLLYLAVSLLYQYLCLIQWLVQLFLKRTYRQVNQSHRYKSLYQIVPTGEGTAAYQQIRLMQRGCAKGIKKGIQNALSYFWK